MSFSFRHKRKKKNYKTTNNKSTYPTTFKSRTYICPTKYGILNRKKTTTKKKHNKSLKSRSNIVDGGLTLVTSTTQKNGEQNSTETINIPIGNDKINTVFLTIYTNWVV